MTWSKADVPNVTRFEAGLAHITRKLCDGRRVCSHRRADTPALTSRSFVTYPHVSRGRKR